MEIIKEKKNTNIILAEKEKITITNKKGHIKIIIKSIGNTLFVDEENEEQKAIKAMEEYLKKNK